MRKIVVALMAGGMAAMLLVSGCGAGDDSGASAGAPDEGAPPIGKVAFAKRADAICKTTNEKILREGTLALRKVLKDGEQSQEDAEISVIATVSLPLFQNEVDELRALGAPQGDEDQVDAFLDATQKVVDEAMADPERYLEAQTHFERPWEEAQKMAQAFGITACPQV